MVEVTQAHQAIPNLAPNEGGFVPQDLYDTTYCMARRWYAGCPSHPPPPHTPQMLWVVDAMPSRQRLFHIISYDIISYHVISCDMIRKPANALAFNHGSLHIAI